MYKYIVRIGFDMREEMKVMDEIVHTIKDAFKINGTDRVEDIEFIVEQLGGTINRVDNIDSTSITILVKKDKCFEISIIEGLNSEMEKFYICMKLGYLFLGMRYRINNEIWNSFKDNECYENDTEQMNDMVIKFIISFLIPREMFIKIMKENYNGNGSYDIEEVAKYFDVDKNLILFRARELYMMQ